ncbi:MAG TPA: WYL domain-containing protein [Solirubrobacterales bacterium]|nr:WYL domain-containing protein [Solirubrobacterales bacterium]
MAKDTEKLIRQLSLISFLMAERRPVSALEIKQDVEGYSEMNDDAFARRFYADRAELEALGIDLKVEKPPEGYFEAELYTLPPENFYLPPIEFSDGELAALQTSLALLDGRFAYAEPLRLALQQLSWGRPSPLGSGGRHQVAVAVTASAGGRELSQRLAKVETAISRRKTIEFEYYSIERDAQSKRKVDPYHLLYQGGQFYLVGHSHERGAMRVFRLSRITDKVSYASKAEHDFTTPEDFDPWAYARRADWQLGEPEATAQVWISERIAWLVERDFGQYGEFTPVTQSGSQWRAGSRRVPGPGAVFTTEFAQPRQLVSWVLGLGEHARLLEPSELVDETAERLMTILERHADEHPDFVAEPARRRRTEDASANGHQAPDRDGQGETVIRPERFARLVALAGILIQSARGDAKPRVADVRERLQITEEELREDLDVLNVVNFGGGSYVLYAEIQGEEIDVDPEPYSDNFARPARLLPLEAKALVAAIDLLGDHLPEGSLASARQKIVSALGDDPSHEGLQIAPPVGDDEEMSRTINRGIVESRLVGIEYYKENEDEFTERTVEPYALINGKEGWYVFSYDLDRQATRHFRLDRIKRAKLSRKTFTPRPEVDPTADLEGWPRTGAVPASRVARVWVSPERARWERERRAVSEELADGALIVELPFAGVQWLVREVLKEAGDAAVLEPADARAEVHDAAKALAGKRRRTKAAA